jgi:PAS domain-containing protein
MGINDKKEGDLISVVLSRRLLDQIPDAIIARLLDGRLVDWNRGARWKHQ